MKKALLLIIPMLFILAACKKQKHYDPRWDPPIVLPYVWQSPLNDSDQGYVSMDLILRGEHIVSSFYQYDPAGNEELIAYNKNNGETAWNWGEFPSPSGQFISRESASKVWGNTLAATSGSDVFALDMESGQTLWSNTNEAGKLALSQHENLIFHNLGFGYSPSHVDSCKIQMTSINDGNWKTVFTLYSDDVYYTNLNPPAVYINEDADTLLLFVNSKDEIYGNEFEFDFYCYNMSQDSIHWIQEDFLLDGRINTAYPPVIDGDYVITYGSHDIHCLNILSGEIIWSEAYNKYNAKSNLLVYNNLLLTTADYEGVIGINKFTGKLVWSSSKALVPGTRELRLYNDRVYVSSGNLYIFDAIGGVMLYKIASPNKDLNFADPVAFDVSSNKMYITDGHYMICMEVPE